MATRRRTAAQKRATRKLVAFNRSRRKTSTRRKPVRRTRTRTTTAATVRRRSPRRVTRRVRRNPAPRKNLIQQTIMPAAMESVGALGLDVLMGYGARWLPANLQTGPLKTIVKGAAAIGIGMVASRFMKNTTARDMARGALVVTMHDAARQALQNMAPQIPLGAYDDDIDILGMGIYSDFGDYNTAPAIQFNDGVGAYVEDYEGMGAYVDYDDF